MGFHFGGTSATVKIEGGLTASIPTPSSDQDLISMTGTTAAFSVGGTTKTLYTVTEGKKFYMTHCSIFRATGAQSSGTWYMSFKDNGGTDKLRNCVRDNAGIDRIWELPTPIVFNTNVELVFTTAASTVIAWEITGFEV